MSNALAIATVTETLQQVLSSGINGARVENALVTALRPDVANGLPHPGVNIFLYQVSPNPSWRNADLPTRSADGKLLSRPTIGLDLHYLLTFYGDDTRLEQQRLLGAVARTLHAAPTLPRTAIEHVQSTIPFLAGANLAGQPELVRFTPIAFSLEELSKLWSFLLKIDYVLSTAYVASVVLIETDDAPPPPALPVLRRTLTVLPFSQPIITAVISVSGPGGMILPESRIDVIGQNLVGPPASTTQLLLSGVPQTPLVASPTRITALVPHGLAAGPQTAQVRQNLLLGIPPSQHQRGFQSNVATLVLHPAIRRLGSPPGSYDITVQHHLGSPPATAITLGVIPTVRQGQRAVLELLQSADPSAAHLFDAGIMPADTDTLVFQLGLMPSGAYLVRVWVDGAESPFDLDPSGMPTGPTVTL
jgi:hypothetical protein